MNGQFLLGNAREICGPVSIDSRSLRAGDVFFALKGPRFDGHKFLRAAADRGAAVAVVDRPEALPQWDRARAPAVILVADTLRGLQDLARYRRAQSKALVIGITGSNGKTTTKEMLAAILSRVGPTLATRGNFNNQIGLPLTLSRLLPEHRFAVIEMGTSHPKDMELLADLTRPEVAIITNVGRDHLEFLHTPEGVLAENRVLFDRMPKEGIALINLDDPLLKRLVTGLSCRAVTYGSDPAAQIRAGGTSVAASSLRFQLTLDGKSFDAMLHTPNALQVRNALAAAATAQALGIGIEDILAGLADFRPPAMRLHVFARSDGSQLINDAYNANPSSVRASVESFCESYPDRPRWLVLGDMRELGPLARPEHEELGRWLALQALDRIYLYGRDTRYVEAALAAGATQAVVERYRKKRELLAALQQALPSHKPVVLFKASRSLRLEQVIDPLKEWHEVSLEH